MPLKTATIVFILAFCLVCSGAWSQQKRDRVQLQSINAIGLLNGNARTSLLLQTILGASFKQSFAGIGVGLDHYRFRSVPLFVDLRHEFGKTNRRFFIYGDVGYHFDWLTDENRQKLNSFSPLNDFRGGTYYDVGAGWAIRLKTKDAILISAGYTYKYLGNTAGSNSFCPVGGPCSQKEEYTYSLRRVAVKAAFAF